MVLDPDVVTDLLSVIIFSVNTNNVQKGMSKFAKGLNQKIAISDLIIEDNRLLKGANGSSSFARERVAQKSIRIIDKEILSSFLYNSYTANKEHRNSTGHAVGGIHRIPAIGPTNLLVSPGIKTKDELIKEIKKNLSITNLSCFSDSVSDDFTGVVEDGEVGRPVIEIIIAGNFLN